MRTGPKWDGHYVLLAVQDIQVPRLFGKAMLSAMLGFSLVAHKAGTGNDLLVSGVYLSLLHLLSGFFRILLACLLLVR